MVSFGVVGKRCVKVLKHAIDDAQPVEHTPAQLHVSLLVRIVEKQTVLHLRSRIIPRLPQCFAIQFTGFGRLGRIIGGLHCVAGMQHSRIRIETKLVLGRR